MDAFSTSDYVYWWGPAAEMWSFQEARLRRRFAEPRTHLFKVVDDSNGTVVAFAKWDAPPHMTSLDEGYVLYDEAGNPIKAGESEGDENVKTDAKRYTQELPASCNIALFEDFLNGLLGMEKKYNASEKLVLSHLCTRHSYHGRGLGTALLRSVLDVADKEGISSYLEASRIGASLYRRLGFVDVDTIELTHDVPGYSSPVTIYTMIREPQQSH